VQGLVCGIARGIQDDLLRQLQQGRGMRWGVFCIRAPRCHPHEVGVSFAFGRHDANGDTVIDAQESRGLLAAMGVTGDTMGDMFEDVDLNHDRKVT